MPEQSMGSVPFDHRKALAGFGNDWPFLEELVSEFMETTRGRIAVIDRALASDDAASLRDEAHAIRGGAANLSADALAEAARRLEQIALFDGLAPASDATRRLVEEFTRFAEYFHRLCGDPSPVGIS